MRATHTDDEHDRVRGEPQLAVIQALFYDKSMT